jgi:DNA-binding winged helix-turn-helix (wHTH) protein
MKTLGAKKLRFADFELDVAKRRLFKQGVPLSLNSKTFDLLLALVEHQGQVLTKDELLEKVWAGQFVEEGNLKVQVRALRKTLGEKKGESGFIVTVPGRGYSFVADVENGGGEIVVESHRLSRIVVDDGVVEGWTGSNEATENEAASKYPGWIRRNRRSLLGAAFGLATLFSIGYILERSGIFKKPPPFQQMSIKRLTSIGNVAAASISPDGKLYAYAVHEVDKESLWVGHVDGGDALQIRPPDDLVYLGIRFTPDGSSIYYTTSGNFEPGTLFRIPVFGGAPEKIGDNFKTLTFSPDGKQFAFVRYDEERKTSFLIGADAKGGNEHALAVLPSSIAADWHSPAWSPDGKLVAMAATAKDGEPGIFMVDLSDSSIHRLQTRTWTAVGALVWLADGRGLATVAVEKDAIHSQVNPFAGVVFAISPGRRASAYNRSEFLRFPNCGCGRLSAFSGRKESIEYLGRILERSRRGETDHVWIAWPG